MTMPAKTIVACLALFTLLLPPLWAQQAPATQDFNIRFFDQKVYFLGDAIQIEAVVTNNGTDTMRFKVADNRFFNLDLTYARR